jgi:hypothetical protein
MNAQDIILSLTARGLSQKEISALTGAPAWTLSRWSYGQAPKSVCHALALQRIYSASTADKKAIAKLKAQAAA